MNIHVTSDTALIHDQHTLRDLSLSFVLFRDDWVEWRRMIAYEMSVCIEA